ncbi:Gfo/Idh/MocA family protein [Halococcus agarilyticus]|uniref:Gfo/Idh/MocA family protein n=1 Tax=Halococcus agarilyticus TaxID=1232219 RepID=UPI000677F23E|nr:Gfo/Idh/MocA family oxidoreductase [Halococcus agarilyticus]
MTVELAFIGAGGIANRHLEHIKEHDGATVTAICDIDEDVAEEAAEPFGADVFTDYRDLYERSDFDAVIVAVPPFAHEDQERLAVEHGVDLFVEKPLALESETARENAAAVAESDIISQVGHMSRYTDSVQRAKELVDDRTLSMVDARWWCGVPGDEDHWWCRKELSGGQVIEQATHTYDLVRHFAGDVETVRAAGAQQVNTEVIDFEDSTSATLVHEDGTVSSVTATSTAEEGGANEIHLLGDGFSLHVDLWSDSIEGGIDGERIEYESDGENWGPEMDAFIEAVRTQDQSLCRSPYADARKTFETTLAVDRALESGEAEAVRE